MPERSEDVIPLDSESLVSAFLAGDSTFYLRCRKQPELMWLAIVELSRRTLTDKQVQLLAAGPLEDVLAEHGEAFIDRVENEARTHRAFRDLLGGVWRNRTPEDVWRRVEKIRGIAW